MPRAKKKKSYKEMTIRERVKDPSFKWRALGGGLTGLAINSERVQNVVTTAGANQYLRTRYQHEWVRPNGEVIKLRGFMPDDLKRLQSGFEAVDQQLRPNIRLSNSLKGGIMSSVKGGHLANYRATTQRVKLYDAAFGNSNNSLLRPNKYNPAGVLVHELGHVVDKATPGSLTGSKAQESAEAAIRGKALGWTRIPMINKETNTINKPYLEDLHLWQSPFQRTTVPSINVNQESYQKTLAFEDFAETFRHMMGLRIKERLIEEGQVGGKVKERGPHYGIKVTKARGRFASEVTPQAAAYMRKNIVNPHGPNRAAKTVIRKSGPFTTRNMVIGGAALGLVGGGSYYYYRRRKNRLERVRNARRRKHQLKRTSAHSTARRRGRK